MFKRIGGVKNLKGLNERKKYFHEVGIFIEKWCDDNKKNLVSEIKRLLKWFLGPNEK